MWGRAREASKRIDNITNTETSGTPGWRGQTGNLFAWSSQAGVSESKPGPESQFCHLLVM